MLNDNPLFSKESLKMALNYLCNSIYTLRYDNNDLPEQIKAGEELNMVKYILATINDHIFDYAPYNYYMNDYDQKEYPIFLQSFIPFINTSTINALNYLSNNFELLDTITRDNLNQHRIPRRDFEQEKALVEIFCAILDNIDEVRILLNQPKKTSDPNKPTAEEIKDLISAISAIQNQYSKMSDERGDYEFTMRAFEMIKMFELFKNALCKAWEVNHYGWHSDFWKEGDSMLEYDFFEIRSSEAVSDMIHILETASPFAHLERNSVITNGLLKVLRHLKLNLK